MLSICLPLPRDGQYQTQWDYILSSFPPDALYVIGDEADAPTTNVFATLAATYIADGSELPAGKLIVLAADNGRYIIGDENLTTFIHPPSLLDPIYLFGHDTRWLDDEVLGGRVPDHKVFIPTATTDDLWSWQAYSIVAWDRRMKLG